MSRRKRLRSELAWSSPDRIVVRGHDLVQDLIGKASLGDVAFQHTVLQVADHPEQMLVYFTTDEVPAAKLAALAAEIG